MSDNLPETRHEKLDETLAATVRLTIQEREELYPVFDRIGREWKGALIGSPFAVFYWNTGVEGVQVEAGFPVSRAADAPFARSRTVEAAEAFTRVHGGPYEELSRCYSRLYTQMYARGIPASLISREVFLNYDVKNPYKNLTEVQVLVHDWDHRLSVSVERVLGAEKRNAVMVGSENLTPDSTREERTLWIRSAIERLDRLASDDQRYDILSRCAHVFPEERIQKLRSIYEREQDIDAVLGEMTKDPDWYEEPVIEGSVIRVEKVPYNRKAYDVANTEEEKRRAYCHCPMVRDFFGETPTSFCYCGSGWYRRLWEGILMEPLRVKILKALTKGDDICEFAIHLPSRRSKNSIS